LADLTDRHYALFANNQHPMQLDIYDTYNLALRRANSEAEHQRSEEYSERMDEVIAERSNYLNVDEGESLSMDDLQDIHIQVKGELREKHNFNLNTKSKNGDISDYLEARRPFGSTQWEPSVDKFI